jgi:myo-inositol-1(or 4)-monophosphatase
LIEIDIEFVKAIALEAGQNALGMLGDIQPEFKSDHSYVTHIDRQTEKFIQARLSARYPDFAFQGEEYGHFGSDSGPLWAVDPIDGTTNMVFGLPIWGVSIGLVAEGKAAAGVFYIPRTGEMFWGEIGKGSYCNGVRLDAKDREDLHHEDTLGFTSTAIKTLNLSSLTGRVRCLGSIAAEVAYTAKGAFCSHVGINEGANDLAAVLCIAHEAGCLSAYLTGEPLDMADIVREGRTREAFVVAPPLMTEYIQSKVHPRSGGAAETL